jgi:hypothetical protein
MPRRLATALALLAAAAGLAGCFGPRYTRHTYYENRDVTVTLRERQDVVVSYDHPAQISAVRMSHILASLDVRFADQEEKNARTPVVPVEAIYPLGELVSGALAEATDRQEVVVSAQIRSRKFKIFTDKTMTQFVVHMKNDQLLFHIARVDFPVPKNPNERITEPKPGQEYQDFKVVRSQNIVPIGPQSVAVDWRHPDFRTADAIRIGRGGEIERRTILMEEPVEEAPRESPADADAVDLSTLSPEALRALADLEEERRSGAINEAEYVARRRAILEAEAR